MRAIVVSADAEAAADTTLKYCIIWSHLWSTRTYTYMVRCTETRVRMIKKKVKIKRLFVVISILKKAPAKLSSYCVRVTVFITIKNPSKKPRFQSGS